MHNVGSCNCVLAGLVDIDTGSVRKGVELLPLRNKIFSGWYNHVAIRRLTGLTDEQRSQLYDKMLEVCICIITAIFK